MTKVQWHGVVTSVQPRFRLRRAFDLRQHGYPGYAVRVRGSIGSDAGEWWFGVGKGAHEKFRFEVGQSASGHAHPVADPVKESVDYYRVSHVQVDGGPAGDHRPPPWRGPPPPIETYRQRGHRRLSAAAYATAACSACIWGARMPVEIFGDNWDPAGKKWRFETFCYGPKSCGHYEPGPARTVPGSRGDTYEEADRVDEEETAHRGPDD